MLSCKCCGDRYVPSDVIIMEEIPPSKGGGFIYHNYGIDVVCGRCRNAAFSEDDYDEMFSESWVKPCETGKYSE